MQIESHTCVLCVHLYISINLIKLVFCGISNTNRLVSLSINNYYLNFLILLTILKKYAIVLCCIFIDDFFVICVAKCYLLFISWIDNLKISRSGRCVINKFYLGISYFSRLQKNRLQIFLSISLKLSLYLAQNSGRFFWSCTKLFGD